MAIRKVVKIDEALCNGCGECVPACAEGAIQIIDGKARLMGDNLCDGLGACLGNCPEGAITIEERDADDFDEQAVQERLQSVSPTPVSPGAEPKPHEPPHGFGAGGCPGSRMLQFDRPQPAGGAGETRDASPQPSALRQWPIQLHLVPPTAPYYQGADLLLAADCTAFAMGDFHAKHLNGKSLAVACPKLDQGQEVYLQKLVAMIDQARINTLSVLVMEVPCCAGLISLARMAAEKAERKVPVKQIVVGLRGEVLREEWV